MQSTPGWLLFLLGLVLTLMALRLVGRWFWPLSLLLVCLSILALGAGEVIVFGGGIAIFSTIGWLAWRLGRRVVPPRSAWR